MDRSILVRLFGFPATLLHGDLLVADRWFWLRKYLPATDNCEKLIDIGCGSGAFTIGAALLGYHTMGLSWDQRNQELAIERAKICKADNAEFSIQDVRFLNERTEFLTYFDVAICCENIEHILDDRKLMKDIFNVLKPGGYLLITSPNYFYKPMTPNGSGPFEREENGGHVRRGYSASMFHELCVESGFMVDEISSCSGFFSQRVTTLTWAIRPWLIRWILTLPLRILPLIFDRMLHRLTSWPDYSICMVAYKPRFAKA